MKKQNRPVSIQFHSGQLLFGLSALLLAGLPVTARADAPRPTRAEVSTVVTGVSPTAVKIGMSVGLTGTDPKAALRHLGSQVLLKKANANGGVNGRKIDLIVVDDKYDPKLTFEATKTLIEKDQVFALFGYSGTPTVKAVLPTVEKLGIPLITPFSGADVLRTPFNRQIFPCRASASNEAEAMVKHVVEDLGIREIGLIIQDDAFGEGVRAAVVPALDKRGVKPAVVVKYQRDKPDIDGAMKALEAAKPKAIFLFSIESVTISLLKHWQETHKDGSRLPMFVSSSSDPVAVIASLGKYANGLTFTDGVPSPSDTTLAIVRDFQKDMRAAGEALTSGALEGYIGASLLVEALTKAGKEPTHARVVAALEGMQDHDLGGLKVSYTPTFHRGLGQVYWTKIDAGKIVPFKPR